MDITRRRFLMTSSGLVAVSQFPIVRRAIAQEGPIRIGVLYDLSGPLAAAGSMPGSIGTQIAIDLINERGGVGGKRKVEPINADTQSKADVALNEGERLLGQSDILMGVFSSAHAVPLAAKVDAMKKIFWINIAIATAVFQGKNLQYVFRGQVHGDQFGEASGQYIAENAKSKMNIDPKQLKVAILYEDGPYGTGVAGSNESAAKQHGFDVVAKEGYAATSPDLSALVTKLRRARPDVIMHTGYNPDITLFLRQARESGLKFKALVGHGAGYGQIDKLRDTFGNDVNHFHNVDPVAAQLLDPKSLAPGVAELTKILVDRYKQRTGAQEVPTHASMGFNQAWILLNHVLPMAMEKYGGVDPEAIRKAALDVDIPEGGTIQGYGVKFAPPGHPLSGQNLRASPVVHQFVDGKTFVVWPDKLKTAEPVLPLPKTSPYAA